MAKIAPGHSVANAENIVFLVLWLRYYCEPPSAVHMRKPANC